MRQLAREHAQQLGRAIGWQGRFGRRDRRSEDHWRFDRHGNLDGHRGDLVGHRRDLDCRNLGNGRFDRRTAFFGYRFALAVRGRAALGKLPFRCAGETHIRRQEEVALPRRIAVVAGDLRQGRQRLVGRRRYLGGRIGSALAIETGRAADMCRRIGLQVGGSARRGRRLVQLVGIDGFHVMGGHIAQRTVLRIVIVIRLVCIMQSCLREVCPGNTHGSWKS